MPLSLPRKKKTQAYFIRHALECPRGLFLCSLHIQDMEFLTASDTHCCCTLALACHHSFEKGLEGVTKAA